MKKDHSCFHGSNTRKLNKKRAAKVESDDQTGGKEKENSKIYENIKRS